MKSWGLTVTWRDYRGRKKGPRPHLGIPKNVMEEEKPAKEKPLGGGSGKCGVLVARRRKYHEKESMVCESSAVEMKRKIEYGRSSMDVMILTRGLKPDYSKL